MCVQRMHNLLFFLLLLLLYTGGKPITPNDVTDSLTNGHTTENGGVSESVTKSEVSIDQNKSSMVYLEEVRLTHLCGFAFALIK